MHLTEQHIISVNDKRYKDLDRICFLSKNLYNAALYIIKQEFLNTGKWMRYSTLDRKLKSDDNMDYRAISAASSQQILMLLDKNLKSYFSAIKCWKRDNNKFTGCPKFPKYKNKGNGRNIFLYTCGQFKHRGEVIYFPKKEGLKPLRTNCKEGSVKQVRFVPKPDCYIIEVVYEAIEKEQLPDNNRIMSIDLESVEHHDSYVGKRVKRGLFKTKDGILLNADINGSYNIMRKVKGDAVMPPYTGFGYNPVKKFIN